MINPRLQEKAAIQQLQQQFRNNQPIRHVVMDDFLLPEHAASLYQHFPSVADMKTHYKGLNEQKAEHSDLHALHPSFAEFHTALTAPAFVNWLQEVTGIDSLDTIDDRLGYGLHQGANGSFLDIHIDYNLHPIRKLYRKLNLIYFVNEKWESGWGGNLELWDAEVKNCIQSVPPVFNRCVIFECSDISYHGYDRINVPEGITRKSCYQYYFVPAPERMSFHDTIFRPRPEESAGKKALTYTKDYVKNKAKKLLVNLGWKRFLE